MPSVAIETVGIGWLVGSLSAVSLLSGHHCCRLTSIFLVLKLLGFRLKSRLSIGSRSLSIHKCVFRIVSHNILTLWLIHIPSAAFWRHPAFHQLLVVIIDLPEISPMETSPSTEMVQVLCGYFAAKSWGFQRKNLGILADQNSEQYSSTKTVGLLETWLSISSP